MSKKVCALCNTEITKKNDSHEHLIPNAIGGRKKIRGFICNNCNKTSGNEWDSELAKQLNPLSLFFGIKRERGKVQSQLFETTGGDKLFLNEDGSMNIEKPLYVEEKLSDTDNATQIKISARTMGEAKKMLKGVKRKYPKIDENKVLENFHVNSYYSKDMIKFNLSIGGHLAGCSIVKSALALAVEAGVPPQSCEHAINYLKNNDSSICYGFFYEKDLIEDRPEGIPFHCITIKGCPDTQQLLGYVEYYGAHRMVLCLSSNYEGKAFEKSYAINPIIGEELDIKVNLELTSKDIEEAYNYEKFDKIAVEEAFGKVFKTGIDLSFHKEKERVINEAVKIAFANCGAKEGEELTPEQQNKLVGDIWKKLEPFILRHIVRSEDPKH